MALENHQFGSVAQIEERIAVNLADAARDESLAIVLRKIVIPHGPGF
jgi:hypothetical protein